MRIVPRDLPRLGHLGSASLYLLAAQAFGATLGYVFWFVVARNADAASVGEAGALVSALSLLMVLATSGVSTTLTVELPRRGGEDASPLVRTAAAAALLLAAALVLLLAASELLFGLWPALSDLTVLLALSGAVLVASVSNVLDAASVATASGRIMLVRTVLAAALRIMLLAAFVAFRGELGAAPIMAIWFAALAGTFVIVLPLWRAAGLLAAGVPAAADVLRFVRRSWWNQAGLAVPRAVPFVLPILVTWRAGAEENAGFFLAWQLATGCFMVVSAVTGAFLAGGPERTHARARRSVLLLLLLGVPAALATALAGPVVLSLLGGSYTGSTGVLLVLCLAAAPLAAASLSMANLRLAGHDAPAAAVGLLASAVLVAVGMWRLPYEGPVGMAWSYFAAQVFATLAAAAFSRRLGVTLLKEAGRRP